MPSTFGWGPGSQPVPCDRVGGMEPSPAISDGGADRPQSAPAPSWLPEAGPARVVYVQAMTTSSRRCGPSMTRVLRWRCGSSQPYRRDSVRGEGVRCRVARRAWTVLAAVRFSETSPAEQALATCGGPAPLAVPMRQSVGVRLTGGRPTRRPSRSLVSPRCHKDCLACCGMADQVLADTAKPASTRAASSHSDRL
jgi:hypothetical protein